MGDTLKMTDTYWGMLKSLSDDIKLRSATHLTASVVAGRVAHKGRTQDMIEKYVGKWKDERSAEKIIKGMYESQKNIKTPLNFG